MMQAATVGEHKKHWAPAQQKDHCSQWQRMWLHCL